MRKIFKRTLVYLGVLYLGVFQPLRLNAQNDTAVKKDAGDKPKVSFADAQPEDITDENFPDMIESFDYPDADIMDVVKAISKLTGKNFIIDQGVRGKISIVAPSPISKAEAYRAFLSALAINGMTIVPSGKFLKIRPAKSAIRDSIETYGGAYYPNADQLITRIIHLKYISADEVNKNLRMLASREGEITAYPQTNSIIISDYGSNVERVMKILTLLDVPTFEEQMEVIHIKHARAKDIAELIDQIVNKGEKPSQQRSRFSSSISRSRRGREEKNESFFVIPDDRTNALIIVGNKQGIQKVVALVKRLDYKLSAEESAHVHVYYVRHGDAETIAGTLSGIAKEATTQQKDLDKGGGAAGGLKRIGDVAPVEPVFGGDVKVTADKVNNSLIITASLQDFNQVKAILEKIDVPRDQVYVETIIMEMTASQNEAIGINYYRFGEGGVGRVGFRGGPIALDPMSDSGAILGFASGDEVKVTFGGQEATVKTLTGFINFLKSQTQTNILSTPQVMALDNEDAEIEVGDNIPVAAETTNTAAGSQTSIKMQKATIKLAIKPFISPESDVVRLKIDQSIIQLAKKAVEAKQLADAAVVTTDRSLKTNIVLRSGDTAVLGGLMSDRSTDEVTKVPLLGDIPVLGWLFKSTHTAMEKVNLLIFITPKIIRNRHHNAALLSKKLNERVEFIKDGMDGRDVHGKTFDALYQKAEAAISRQRAHDESEGDDGDDSIEEGVESPGSALPDLDKGSDSENF